MNDSTLKSALIGAAVGAGLGLVTGRSALGWGLVGAAGMIVFGPRGDRPPSIAGEHLVGRLPPGADYSFTRAPGFNSKEY